MYNIAIVGLGHVGISNACLLAKHNRVTALDISHQRVVDIQHRKPPIRDRLIQKFLEDQEYPFEIAIYSTEKLKQQDFIVIATPADYDSKTRAFDTAIVEQIVNDAISVNNQATIVIKSTVPVGFVNTIREKLENTQILFSPEFLREGTALYDNLHPSRVIVGDDSEAAKVFADLLAQAAEKKPVVIPTPPTEAEAIKLFANTYLAMRIAFFNELDSFAMTKGLNTKRIIDGVCRDPRIGEGYNNPSFGYGGYCLPKDTKQILANYKGIPQRMIRAIVDANETRKWYVAKQIIAKKTTVCWHLSVGNEI